MTTVLDYDENQYRVLDTELELGDTVFCTGTKEVGEVAILKRRMGPFNMVGVVMGKRTIYFRRRDILKVSPI